MLTKKFRVTKALVKKAFLKPPSDSHKGQNGKVLIIGGSPLFHGAGRLAAKAAWETIISFSSKTNDMVYFCSTKANLDYLKCKQECFIGITRNQLDHYLKSCNAVLVGTGLMREPEENWPETKKEPLITKQLTQKVLESDKKAVLDAGSLQVISPQALKNKKIIITPHRTEMAKLFSIDKKKLITSHNSSFKEIEKVAQVVWQMAKKYQITILLKGPIDIIAGQNGWYYCLGGNAAMTKGGTGDVLAGVATAIYSKINDPLLAASAASFITKKAGEESWKKQKWFFNASDLINQITKVFNFF